VTTTILLATGIMVLTCALLIQGYSHNVERKDLLNRIMAKDLQEYRQTVNKSPPPKGGNFIKAGLKKHREAMIQDAGSD
jgi:hypothetical protein